MGGRRKALLYLWSSLNFGCWFGWLVENAYELTYGFNPCDIWVPSAALVLWIVSRLVCQAWLVKSWVCWLCKGTWGKCASVGSLFSGGGEGATSSEVFPLRKPDVWTVKHCRCHDIWQRPWAYTCSPGCLPLLLWWDCADRALPRLLQKVVLLYVDISRS